MMVTGVDVQISHGGIVPKLHDLDIGMTRGLVSI